MIILQTQLQFESTQNGILLHINAYSLVSTHGQKNRGVGGGGGGGGGGGDGSEFVCLATYIASQSD